MCRSDGCVHDAGDSVAGIESPRDFIARVPNMTLIETQNVGNSFVHDPRHLAGAQQRASVAVLVDGVLETNPYEFTQELYDIRQIESSKGRRAP